MKIRYQPLRGTPNVVLRDIKGGHEYARWDRDQEREISGTVSFKNDAKPARQMDAAEAIFRHGPDFVDVATGKNPIYSCACGILAMDEGIVDVRLESMPFIKFVEASGHRQCVVCFMAEHPEVIPYLRMRGFPEETIEQAQQLIAKRNVPSATRAPEPAKPAPSEES